MNRALVQRYIELSALLLAPITPHTSEHIWGALLKKGGSVLKAGWPQAAEPDFVMQRAAQYIEGGCRADRAGIAAKQKQQQQLAALSASPSASAVCTASVGRCTRVLKFWTRLDTPESNPAKELLLG